ncbi:MAG: metal ABC transporter permease [Synechococcaceae cyanobacterium]|jgi:manganese transport system permease protein
MNGLGSIGAAAAQWLMEPLQQVFLQRALGLGLLVAAVCALLSCYLTLKGWALMGDAISHAVLPGVVLAHLVGAPYAAGAFLFGVGSVTVIGWLRRHTRLREDALIGVVFTAFFALGLVLISKLRSGVDLSHILFGNLLGLSDNDLLQTSLIALVVLAVVAVRRRDLLLFCFDPGQASAIGLRTGVLQTLLLTLVSLAAVAALQAVGIILVVAMLVTPGATAFLLTDRFDRMNLLAVLAAMLSTSLGLYVSYWLDASTAGCIVLVQAALFALALLLAPRHGLLAQRRRGRRSRSLPS